VPNSGNPSNPTVFYGGPDLDRTTNPSASPPTWTRVTSVGQFVTAIAASPSNPQVVYVGFENGTVQVSTDGGVNFTSLAAEPFSEQWVTGLSVDPSNPKAITASFSFNDTRYRPGLPHVAQYSYGTTPGSGTWTVITGNLPSAAVSRVVYDNGALVAATDKGVYATGAPSGGSTSWSPVGTGLPAVQVQDLDVENDGLYAVTFGRGAWKLPPFTGYPRPRGATPIRVSLVPAYRPCTSANSTHGAPLAHASCVPPTQASAFLTVGTADANGAAANSVGSVLLKTVINPAPTQNDVRINVSTTDVRCKSTPTTTCGSTNSVAARDYTGQLQARETLRVTDQQNGGSTVVDVDVPESVQCAATPDTSVGSNCSVATTANTLFPGLVTTGDRTIWQVIAVKLNDGGSSGTAGASDATLFEDRGVFVP
jgi:hypothetical protein